MKFVSTILFASLAILTAAAPVADTEDNNIANSLAVDDKDATTAGALADCKPCDDYYLKCRGSPWCWLNPYGCDVSCLADTCRALDGFCKRECNYKRC